METIIKIISDKDNYITEILVKQDVNGIYKDKTYNIADLKYNITLDTFLHRLDKFMNTFI